MSTTSYERAILTFWQENDVYSLIEKMEESIDNENEFVFIDGPPFVSGDLHVGHLCVGSIKDTMLRYQRMHGKKCNNKLGFDTHGLPSESACMKLLGLVTNDDIKKYGVGRFNDECINMINRFTKSWKPIYDRCGRWSNFDNIYKTLDVDFMESVWWSFKQLYEKELVYQGHTVMPYSWKLETPLSNFEAGQNYKEIDTKSIYVTFDLESDNNIKFVAWTTTPWTLPSNFALCVNPTANYMKCTTDEGISYIVGENYVKNLKMNFSKVEFYAKGNELAGVSYTRLFNFLDVSYHKILADPYVKDSAEIGTGIVHIAPAYGDDDYRICKNAGIICNKNIDKLCPIDSIGRFLPIIEPYAGILVFDADKLIIKDLTEANKVLRIQSYKHTYPFCDRTDTPLIYRTCESVFVEVTKLRSRMIELNDKIIWAREEIGQKKFQNWLSQTRDWSLSRNRNFGTPIPIWQTDDMTETIVVGSIEELMKLAELSEPLTDLHPQYIDPITFKSPTTGKLMRRISAVFDCWYESGSVPFAKLHYPFENSNYFDNMEYLSDFVAEGLDQTRGWFYTLLVLSTALFDKPPFKHCICSGLVLDEHGVKFSKKYGNFLDSNLLLEEYGSDTLRLYLEKSPLVNGQELLFKVSDVKDITKRLIPYLNGISFFLNHLDYAYKSDESNISNIGYINYSDISNLSNVTDIWILERIYNLRKYVELHMNDYHIDKPVNEILNFVDDLTNWYIKFNRLRMKGKYGQDEQILTLSVLYTVLYDYVIICSPFMPFLSEHIYQQLKQVKSQQNVLSVHMLKYPNIEMQNVGISESFKKMQTLCSMIRNVRDRSTTHNSIKVPIKSCIIYEDDQTTIKKLQSLLDIIQDEVNCNIFEFQPVPLKTYQLKPNFKLLGAKYKKHTQQVCKLISSVPSDSILSYLEQGCGILGIIDVDKIYEIEPEEFEIVSSKIIQTCDNSNIITKEQDNLMLSIDLTLSYECIEKYFVKCFCKEIQNIRKDMGLKQWNKISIAYYTESQELQKYLSDNIETLSQLSDSISFEYFTDGCQFSINNHQFCVKINSQT